MSPVGDLLNTGAHAKLVSLADTLWNTGAHAKLVSLADTLWNTGVHVKLVSLADKALLNTGAQLDLVPEAGALMSNAQRAQRGCEGSGERRRSHAEFRKGAAEEQLDAAVMGVVLWSSLLGWR